MANTVNMRTGVYETGGITFTISDADLGGCGITDCPNPAFIVESIDDQGGARCPDHYMPWAVNA